MNGTVYSKDGKELRTIELADAVFGLPVNEDLIYYAINNELANKRQGNACTKDRGEVHGSNAKPYRQKGTGRARRGDKKSPLLIGGGTIFGPKPRDYSWSMPKKAKRQAMKTILSLKAQSQMLKIIEDFSIETGKTRDLAGLLNNFNPGTRTVLVLKDDDPMIKRAAANKEGRFFIATPRPARAFLPIRLGVGTMHFAAIFGTGITLPFVGKFVIYRVID
jgi:large subunit ribosomal protein L4